MTPFLSARGALDAGAAEELAAILDEHPDLVHHKHFDGEWYDSGYFAGAMLLHHVAGNPIRCPLPDNILEITRLLLERGADPNATCGERATVGGLVLTSKQASEAGVALPLLEILIEAGARIDLDAPGVLDYPLWNDARATAEALVRRGSPMELRHAAALGRVDALQRLMDVDQLDEALIMACVRGELESVRALVGLGARGDRIGDWGPATALHEAANRGHVDIVAFLLESGTDATVPDRRFGGTAAQWAEHGRPEDLAAMRALFGGGDGA
jgi:hypothetical protein